MSRTISSYTAGPKVPTIDAYIGEPQRREQHHPQRHHLDRRASDLADAGEAAGSPDDLMTTIAVGQWLGLSKQWLEIGRSKNYGPRFVMLSTRRIRYRRSDVLAWLGERTYTHTSEYRDVPRLGRPPGVASPVATTCHLVRRAPLPASSEAD